MDLRLELVEELTHLGVDISEVFHDEGGVFHHAGNDGMGGWCGSRAPQRRLVHPVHRPLCNGRMGTISDIVDGVLYLENAPFVTGEILHVDGGQSAGR